MTSIRTAFVMEQSLGHVTHGMNLRRFLATQSEVVPTWLPIAFEPHGFGRGVPVWRSNATVRGSWRARRALQGALGSAPHDAAVFHTQTVSVFSTTIMQRLPSVISLDGTPINFDSVGEFYGHRQATDGWLDRQKFGLVRRAFHAATALVSWSEWAKRSLIEDYGVDAEQIRILAPGASPDYFEIGQRRFEAAGFETAGNEGESEGDRRPVRILFVGGDFQRKGGDLLLECMEGPLGERCELHLVTQDTSVAPRPNVHVYRNVGPNSPELLRLFAAADVFALPSRAECLAVVLMEATAAGLPVVTTAVGALNEAVRPGQSGFVVPVGDAGALGAALQTLAADGALRRCMGRVGHALAGEKFNAARNNRALLDLVVEVAQAGRELRSAA
jgi:glycosyltransferase involved in cell wall biosynthesis